jgi:hypothetical protein
VQASDEGGEQIRTTDEEGQDDEDRDLLRQIREEQEGQTRSLPSVY